MRITVIEFLQWNQFVDDQVGFVAAATPIDFTSGQDDGVGLDTFATDRKPFGPHDASNRPCMSSKSKFAYLVGAPGFRVFRVSEFDRTDHAAEHHFAAIFDIGEWSVVCERKVASFGSNSASGWLAK